MSTPETEPGEEDPLVKEVQLRDERHRRWLREGDPSVARRLAQIGVLGCIIVVPMLLAFLSAVGSTGHSTQVCSGPHRC